MDYKTKYLKYKSKYFDLKNEIEGGAIERIKKMFNSKETTPEEKRDIATIAEIVGKLKNHKSYPKDVIKKSTNKYSIFVREFLAFVNDLKKNYDADIHKLGVTPENLDFLLGKHYLCKKSQMSLFYEVSECKLNKKTSSSTKSDKTSSPAKTSSSSTKSDKTTSPTKSDKTSSPPAKTASPSAKTASPPAKTASPPAKTATKKK